MVYFIKARQVYNYASGLMFTAERDQNIVP